MKFIIKIFNKILGLYELKLSKKEGKYGRKMGLSKELRSIRGILDETDTFLYEADGRLTFRHYRWYEFQLDKE